MKYKWRYLLIIICVTFFIIGVPIIINELYKTNKGYITLWGASELLSYYGTILGAIATIIAVFFTIRFTKKQICYESTIQHRKQKWEQVDKLLQHHFELSMPTKIMQIYSFSDFKSNPYVYIEKIRVRTMEIKTSLDWIKTYLNPEEYENISKLIDKIVSFDDRLCDVCSKISECIFQFAKNEVYEKNRNIIEEYKNILSNEELEKYRNGMKENQYVEPNELSKNIHDLSMQLIDIQGTQFHNLLNLKRDTFNLIYEKIDNNEQKKLDELI